jgi:hypothetical protein
VSLDHCPSDDELRAIATRRAAERDRLASHRTPAPKMVLVADSDPELEKAREKQVEQACDKLALAMGCEIMRYSQPRATKQTPGIPDRRYRHRSRGFVFWFECKATDGKQSPAQREFQLGEEACGQVYVLGGRPELARHLASLGCPVPDDYLTTTEGR